MLFNYTPLIVIIVFVVLYYIINFFLWYSILMPFGKKKFDIAIERIKKYNKFSFFFKRRKMLVFLAASAIYTDNDELFLDTIKKINKNSVVVGKYYYYYYMIYSMKKNDFISAEKLYDDLTKCNYLHDLDLITPLAILMQVKKDKDARKKLISYRNNPKIDQIFIPIITYVLNHY